MPDQSTRRRAGRRHVLWSCALLMSLSLVPGPVRSQGADVIVVRSDRGGLLGQRSDLIRDLQASGQRVELRGICLSACTMYLGLPNVCVAESGRFGFHGPSWYGADLPAREFEHWSKVMARYYREPLKTWFMSKARFRTSGYYEVRGAELIRMGYPTC